MQAWEQKAFNSGTLQPQHQTSQGFPPPSEFLVRLRKPHHHVESNLTQVSHKIYNNPTVPHQCSCGLQIHDEKISTRIISYSLTYSSTVEDVKERDLTHTHTHPTPRVLPIPPQPTVDTPYASAFPCRIIALYGAARQILPFPSQLSPFIHRAPPPSKGGPKASEEERKIHMQTTWVSKDPKLP